MDDEAFKGNGDGLEEEEFEYHPSLEHEVTSEAEKSREEECDVGSDAGRLFGTVRELQKLVRNEPSQPCKRLVVPAGQWASEIQNMSNQSLPKQRQIGRSLAAFPSPDSSPCGSRDQEV